MADGAGPALGLSIGSTNLAAVTADLAITRKPVLTLFRQRPPEVGYQPLGSTVRHPDFSGDLLDQALLTAVMANLPNMGSFGHSGTSAIRSPTSPPSSKRHWAITEFAGLIWVRWFRSVVGRISRWSPPCCRDASGSRSSRRRVRS